jgi:hypothetical protein
MEKTLSNSIKRRDAATLTARIHGVSDNYVRKVLRGERENEEIFSTYMTIIEQDNLLLQAVRRAVPL